MRTCKETFPAALALAFCFGLCCAPAAKAQNLADVIEEAEKSVVRIEVRGSDGDSLGSGFVIDDQGTIITNCHVLAGASAARVHFPDGRSGDVLGTLIIDETRDIVVARISDTTAPAIRLATDLPRKGEKVTALGSPHGLSFTATTGIVSAIRPAKEMASDTGRGGIQGTWIQVDAALSPGNSGGPLINSSGEVVGMSTLASQGSAQNLNFGISSMDIRNAVKYSRYGKLAKLQTAAAKISMSESGSGGGGLGEPPGAKPIPPEVLQQYVERGREDFSDLMRGLRMESARLRVDLKEMRNGSTRLPGGLAREGVAIMKTDIPGRRGKKWFFLSSSVKDEAIQQQRKRIETYDKLKNQIKDIDDHESLFQLLWNYGPPINLRDKESVGFISDMYLLHAFDSHITVAAYEEAPYLLWLDSTSGINGGEIHSGPIFVAGTMTLPTESGLPRALTILQEVTEEQLREAISQIVGSDSQLPAGFRYWTDRSGKHKTAAKLLGSDSEKAVLQKEDGTIVNVPISSLCDEDQQLLRQ